MKKNLSHFWLHLLVFIGIETLFVFVLFRELPETNLITLIGLLHTSYWLILLFAWWLRERMHNVWQKALCTFLPVVYHLFTHLYAGWIAIEMQHAAQWNSHDEHELGWIIAGACFLWILIFIGEYLLHRKIHCDSHHAKTHAHCHDKWCETIHESP